jgi:hypothetical protein
VLRLVNVPSRRSGTMMEPYGALIELSNRRLSQRAGHQHSLLGTEGTVSASPGSPQSQQTWGSRSSTSRQSRRWRDPRPLFVGERGSWCSAQRLLGALRRPPPLATAEPLPSAS